MTENGAPLSIQQEHETYVREDGSTFTRRDIFVKLSVVFRDRMLRKLKGPKLSVYLCIALHCGNEEMIAWPSIVTIEAETGYGHTAVIGAIQDLEAMELIEVEHRLKADGSADSNRYKVRGYATMGEGSSPSVPPVVHLVNGGSSPSVPKEESMEEEEPSELFPPAGEKKTREQPSILENADPLALAAACYAKMDGQRSWTVTGPEGANPYEGEPLQAFCEVAKIPERPPDGKARQWGAKLQEIGEAWSAAPGLLTEAIRAIPKSHDHNWRSFGSPFSKSFQEAMDAMIPRVRSGGAGKVIRIRN